MQVFLFLALTIALIAALFAIQNVAPVTVSFVIWTFEGSLAVILFVAVLAGALASGLASIPTIVRGKWQVAALKKRVIELEAQQRARMATLGVASPAPAKVIPPDAPSHS